MSTITTRAGKGSALTHNEVDANFTNLNTDKINTSVTLTANYVIKGNGTNAAILSGIYEDGSGDVGVGTASPGGWRLNVSSGSTNKLRLYNTTGSSNTIDFVDQSWQSQIVGSAGALLFNAGGTSERVRIDSSGNLLIGTTTADGMLTVSAPASTSYGSLNAVTSGFANLSFKVGGTVYGYIGSANAFIAGGTASDFGFRSQNAVTFATGGSTERMRIDASGNVGIGTASPNTMLQVYRNVANTPPYIRVENGSSGNTFDYASYIMTTIGVTGGLSAWAPGSARAGQLWLSTDASYPLVFGTADTERLRIDSSGNVGIGETAPDYKLDVNGSFGFTPGSSVTPVDNGDVVFELTNNTTLTIKAKGSDGTVRSATITLA